MMKLHRIFYAAALLAISVGLSGCKDEIIPESPQDNLVSRVGYDDPPVEWDNVNGIQVLCSNSPGTTLLPIPWISGTTSDGTIPYSWVDKKANDPAPKKRAYSRENGWEMVFHNLLDPKEMCKYFGLYNRYTGVLRMFFYEINPGANFSTTYAWTAFRISGMNSLLNFASKVPRAMNDRQNSPTLAVTSAKSIYDLDSSHGYTANKWYSLEVELAYDPSLTHENTISAWLWGETTSTINLSGTNIGSINGSIETIFSNTPNGGDFSVNLKGDDVNINVGETDATEKLGSDEVANKGFVKNLWAKVKSGIPEVINKGLKSGVETLLSGGSSIITKGLSKLLGLSGRSTMPMSATSKVDLGLNSDIKLEGTLSSSTIGWGYITPFDLPQFATNNQLSFKGNLGVWNLRDYPKVTVDMLMTSMYYPKELVPNPQHPQACYPTFTYKLTPAELVVNPDMLIDYKVENLTQTLVYTTSVSTTFATIEEPGSEYGLHGDIEYYEPKLHNSLTLKGMGKSLFGNWDPYNLEASYSCYWSGYENPTTKHDIMCHVYFELVSKSDSNERYAYSKYFPCTAVKGNFSHREEIITK